MGGVFPTETSIYIVAANTNASALSTTDKISGEISNFELSGLNIDPEYKNLFGGQLEIVKPRGEGELTFDISVSNTVASSFHRWSNMDFPTTGTSIDTPASKMVYISFYSNSLLNVLALNNAKVTTHDTSMSAEEELQKSVTLKFAYMTPLGTANVRASTVSGTTLVGNTVAFLNAGVWSSN
jgi:hypothetical protein